MIKVEKIISAILKVSKTGTPYINIKYQSDQREEGNKPVNYYQSLWVTEKSINIAKATLKKLGFDTSDKNMERFEEDDFNGAHFFDKELVEKGLYLETEIETYNGKSYVNVKYVKTKDEIERPKNVFSSLYAKSQEIKQKEEDQEKKEAEAKKEAKELIDRLPNRVKVKESDPSDVDEGLPF